LPFASELKKNLSRLALPWSSLREWRKHWLGKGSEPASAAAPALASNPANAIRAHEEQDKPRTQKSQSIPTDLPEFSGRRPDTGASAAGVSARAVRKKEGAFASWNFGADPPRSFMLYEPAARKRGPAPLLVLLHGCGQDARDFAAGTRMNEAAEAEGVVVLYPEQTRAANPMRCWNWYVPMDRRDGEGDAALIAAMTRHVIEDCDIDTARVYVAGMSAGGAMAAVLAKDYPDLYVALGVHSGLPAGMAHDLFSAMRLMSNGPSSGQDEVPTCPRARACARSAACSCEGLMPPIASIVFHGDEDTTVHPSNGQAIHGLPVPAAPTAAKTRLAERRLLQSTTDASDGRRGFTRSLHIGPDGVSERELWIVHGAGHAWAGGSDSGSYTDGAGPDASREMLRFFLQHQRPN
jgi:poly(hydroxyalkanoate) depolymerase family esterase